MAPRVDTKTKATQEAGQSLYIAAELFPKKFLFVGRGALLVVSLETRLYPGLETKRDEGVSGGRKKISKNFNPRGTPFLIFQFLRQKIIR